MGLSTETTTRVNDALARAKESGEQIEAMPEVVACMKELGGVPVEPRDLEGQNALALGNTFFRFADAQAEDDAWFNAPEGLPLARVLNNLKPAEPDPEPIGDGPHDTGTDTAAPVAPLSWLQWISRGVQRALRI